MNRAWILVLSSLALGACSKVDEPAKKDAPAAVASTTSTAQAFGAPIAAQAFGAPIAAQGATVSLADVAASPDKYRAAPFVATGTVGSVCQHRGCWMTLKDENGEAFIRMAGHAFLIPKDATGRKARVLATLAPSDDEAAAEGASCSEGKGHAGCKAEAVDQQGGKPLAKLELQAAGVELL